MTVTCKVKLTRSSRSALRVTLRHGGRVVATGVAHRSGTIRLRSAHTLRHGHYTLTATRAGKTVARGTLTV